MRLLMKSTMPVITATTNSKATPHMKYLARSPALVELLGRSGRLGDGLGGGEGARGAGCSWGWSGARLAGTGAGLAATGAGLAAIAPRLAATGAGPFGSVAGAYCSVVPAARPARSA